MTKFLEEITEEEARDSLFSMEGKKAPSLDDVTFETLCKLWMIIKKQNTRFDEKSFAGGNVPVALENRNG